MSKQKIIEKEYFVELTAEDKELISHAYSYASAANEYYRGTLDKCKVETLIYYLNRITDCLGDIEYKVKSKNKLNFNPKEKAKNAFEKIPFEIKRKQREEA